MSVMNSSASDVSYVDQLRQLFNSCDRNEKGFLLLHELRQLCDKLQLDDEQTRFIFEHIAADDPATEIRFNPFKEVFVTLLMQNEHNEELQQQLSNSSSPLKMQSSHQFDAEMTFIEAEAGATDSVQDTSLSTENYLRTICRKLNVGKDGYLNIDELYAVCEHIGYDVTDDIVLQLFEKLDCDKDGKVGFSELLQLLFEQQLEQSDEALKNYKISSSQTGANCSKKPLNAESSLSRNSSKQIEMIEKPDTESFSSTINYAMSFKPSESG
ncbi:ninein-like protein [Dinothrombium tinctorium]|uniref:Ninein-like protein n=1 Tax=Dinothrombium tinctorium TaxID=1965070 RepID=A0A3S4RIB7_9ACAR|nr:ninein-like protein [Dinothrombium tinctorium]RWS16603.1 ninein-like protein [Dinothrombium tinctorium]